MYLPQKEASECLLSLVVYLFCVSLLVAVIDGLRTLNSVIDTPHSLVVVLGFLAATQWISIFVLPLIQVSGDSCMCAILALAGCGLSLGCWNYVIA